MIKIEEGEQMEEGTEDMFFCSSCKISFHDVDKHLEEHHQGQQVFLEEDVSVNEETTTDPQMPEQPQGDEHQPQPPESPLFQTIKEEQCVDVAGQPYTRKVVQIDKFWDKKEKIQPPDPIVQYFTITDDPLKQADEDEEPAQEGENGNDLLEVFQCPKCFVHFTRLVQYNAHKCGGVKFQCEHCDAAFSQQRSLTSHLRMHSGKGKVQKVDDVGKRHVCSYCNTEFGTYKSLRLHLRMHEPIKSQKVDPPVNYGIMGENLEESYTERVMFTCPICTKEYDEVYRHVHMESHNSQDNYDCTICNRKFYTGSNLEMHMRVHNVDKIHSCSYCKETFDEYKDLKEHMKGHLETRPYQCQYCSRRFVRPHEKVKHERIHTGEKPHACEVCGKTFRVSYCLTLHMRTHSGFRPYQCKECGKRFKSHSVYNHHLLIHSNVRKYKCPYCPKAFKTSVQLAGHKNTHTKPFTCTECNRPFASLYAVRSHMETHKTENNLKYNCSSCGASYARAFALRDHIKACHGGETWERSDDETQEQIESTTIIMKDGEVDGAEIEGVLTLEQAELAGVEMVDEEQLVGTEYVDG